MGRDFFTDVAHIEAHTFQSTRPHGARPCIALQSSTTPVFQSTRPHGARQSIFLDYCAELFVSIHAPAWGATSTHHPISDSHACFNPRARMGRDTATQNIVAIQDVVSIHAPAWGATNNYMTHLFAILSFQSTRPHGARLNQAALLYNAIQVSIHAPAWGATLKTVIYMKLIISFNPRARMGRDNCNPSIIKDDIVSIHAPAWGATAFI